MLLPSTLVNSLRRCRGSEERDAGEASAWGSSSEQSAARRARCNMVKAVADDAKEAKRMIVERES